MARRADAGACEGALDAQAELERMHDHQVMFDHLVRLQAGIGHRIAITRGDHGGHHQAQAMLLELEHLGVA